MIEPDMRKLPAVSKLLDYPPLQPARQQYGPVLLTSAIRSVLQRYRAQLPMHVPELAQLADEVAAELFKSQQPVLRMVINATGIVLHTNLGRAPLHPSAVQAVQMAAEGYLNLELELATGKRSSRQNPIRADLQRLTGAEAATVVNNCAAATVIVLRALAAGKEVIVSRGQLVEIGGSFRIPDILTVSGATLREVGTTNITRLSDYEQAIGPNTGAILRVHASNYRIRGFTKSVGIAELVALGQKHNIPVIDDVGSGAVYDLTPFGLPGEPTISEGIRAGAAIALFSGDKLLGGPQTGCIVGKQELIQRIERDPLMRAFRCDKMTLAALEATLQLYRDPERAKRNIPVLRMLTTPLTELRQRAQAFAEALRASQAFQQVEVQDAEAFVGGGSLPDVALPTAVIALSVAGQSEELFAERLRTGTPAVMARIQAGQVWLDLRTVFAEQEPALLQALQAAAQNRVGGGVTPPSSHTTGRTYVSGGS